MLGWIAGASKSREQQGDRAVGCNEQVAAIANVAMSATPSLPQAEGAPEVTEAVSAEVAKSPKPQGANITDGKKKQHRERRGRERRKLQAGSSGPESGGGTPDASAPVERSAASAEGSHRGSPQPRSTKSMSSPKPQAPKAPVKSRKGESVTALREELSACKKLSAEHQRQLVHYKSAVSKISSEIKGGAALRPELRLAAILAICDEAEAKVKLCPEDNKRRNRRKGRRNKQKPVVSTDIGLDSSRKPAPMTIQAPYQVRHPPAFSGAFLAEPSHRLQYQPFSGFANKPHWVHRGLRVSQSMGPIRAVGNQEAEFVMGPTRSMGSHVLSTMPSVDERHAGPPPRRGVTDLPSLRSAAESDHPICIQLREGLRTATDQQSVLHFIEMASTHKIQDLVDRGRRKLEKLASSQQA